MKEKKSVVYFVKGVDQEAVLKAFEKLNFFTEGKVAMKIHSGEKGNKNFLKPDIMSKLVEKVKPTIVECNTAYEGSRSETAKHLKTLEENGFTSLAPIDIMDSEKDEILPIRNAIYLKEGDYVGKHIDLYDKFIVFSHFKGHAMAGFGGALKQLSIGFASRYGKTYIHAGGNRDFSHLRETRQDIFLDSMAEAASALMDHIKGRVCFINVLKNLSVDCDCEADAELPCMKDIGVLASFDPVAIDRASLDLIEKSDDEGKKKFLDRVKFQDGERILTQAVKRGVGSLTYKLVE
jgi:uncharacterized Fe-S center protein